MPGSPTIFDEVARDLAIWLDQTANEIAIAMAPRGLSPFAAKLTEEQKLAYFTRQFFNDDGSVNHGGRSRLLQQRGAEETAKIYKAVITAHPELRPPGFPQPIGQAEQAPPAPEQEVTYG